MQLQLQQQHYACLYVCVCMFRTIYVYDSWILTTFLWWIYHCIDVLMYLSITFQLLPSLCSSLFVCPSIWHSFIPNTNLTVIHNLMYFFVYHVQVSVHLEISVCLRSISYVFPSWKMNSNGCLFTTQYQRIEFGLFDSMLVNPWMAVWLHFTFFWFHWLFSFWFALDDMAKCSFDYMQLIEKCKK